MTREEFEREWDEAMAKLTLGEQRMVEAVVEGAQVNYTAAYMLASAVVGAMFGYVLAGWVS